MNNDEKISGIQMSAILTLIMVGAGILSLPRFLLEASEVDTWLIILVGGLILMAITFLYGYITSAFPGKGYFEILSITLTKPIAYIVAIVFIFYGLIIAGLIIRIFAETLKSGVLTNTPIEVIMLSMILSGVYGVRRGVGTLGRFAQILFSIMAPIALIVFGLSMVNADFSNLLPIFKISLKELLFALPRVFFSFSGLDFILVYAMFLNKPKNSMRSAPAAVALVTLLYLIINIATIANFGAKQTMVLVWPTFSLIKSIEVPLAFIEDMTSIGAALWMLSVYMSYVPVCLGNNILLGEMIGSEENVFFTLPQLPVVYLASIFPNNITHIYMITDMLTKYVGVLLVLIVPTLILIVMGIKGLKCKIVKN